MSILNKNVRAERPDHDKNVPKLRSGFAEDFAKEDFAEEAFCRTCFVEEVSRKRFCGRGFLRKRLRIGVPKPQQQIVVSTTEFEEPI